MKAIRNISLDVELLQMVKNDGLNLSQMINNYLKAYFKKDEKTKTN